MGENCLLFLIPCHIRFQLDKGNFPLRLSLNFQVKENKEYNKDIKLLAAAEFHYANV